VDGALQPAISYLKREKTTSRPQDPVDFGECAILRLARSQMMQNQNSDHRRKTPVRERQSGGVTLQSPRVRTVLTCRECGCKSVAVLETGDARNAPPQLIRRSAGTRAQLKHVIPTEPDKTHGSSRLWVR